jgi:hypothetical protein
MAAPNIVNVTTITGKTAGLAVTTSASAIITNSASSNKVFKVNALYVANIATSNGWATIDVLKNGSTAFDIGYQITVPVNATLDVLSKAIYLEENDSLRLTANANSTIEAVVSYEEIS